MSEEIRHKILTILAEREDRAMRDSWDEDLWDAVDIPWRRFEDQLSILEGRGLISTRYMEPTEPKYGRYVRITDFGRKKVDH